MAELHDEPDSFATYTSTRKWQLLMTAAVASFVVCHVIVQQTLPAPFGAPRSPDVAIERQLLHFMAELLRFALPYGFLAWGISSYWHVRGKTRP